MKFDTPAGPNPIDRMTVVGRAHDRIDGPLKTTGTAPYAYEHHAEVADPAYGYVVASSIGHGSIRSMDLAAAKAAPGVLAIVTAADAGPLGKGKFNTVKLLGGPQVDHYHQALAVVVAETFEQARAAAALVRIDYARTPGRYDLDEALKTAPLTGGSSKEGSSSPPIDRVGKFEEAFAAAPVTLDAHYSTPDHSHAMMEPFASIAAWSGDHLTVWTSNQMIDWSRTDLATTLGIPKEKITLLSPYIGGG
ncbi:MAG: molybdopterin cofactor-binding domain-containing protein, partial [Janthinobacterium lividum]